MTRLYYTRTLPLPRENMLVIFDRQLLKSSNFKKWISRFEFKYAVTAGENLKALEKLPAHMQKICKLVAGTSRGLVVVGVGGGSVTDFAGFVSSVLRRGVGLTLIPSTWLAAMDSAHGGKTALNVGNFKNQIGTFYPAQNIFLVKELLQGQPISRRREAYGELLKIALISGKAWGKKLLKINKLEDVNFWEFLKPAVEAKYQIVMCDPFEKKGIRQKLNLGHTIGHVLEKKFNLPHGIAVGQGLVFATKWSERLGILGTEERKRICNLVKSLQGPTRARALNASAFTSGLRADKKMDRANKINFIFLEGMGRAVCKPQNIKDVVVEAKRQGWVR